MHDVVFVVIHSITNELVSMGSIVNKYFCVASDLDEYLSKNYFACNELTTFDFKVMNYAST